MQNRFNFNPFQLATVNNFQLSQTTSNSLKPVPVTSLGDDQSMAEEPLVTKSSLAPSTSYQISFEKGFMGEHATVFSRELQNYMESVRNVIIENDPALLKRFPEGLYDVRSGINFEELLQMNGSEMGEEKRMEFITEVKSREKLEEFLNLVTDSCPCQVAAELLFIAQQLLTCFLMSDHKDNPHVELDELLELSEYARSQVTGIQMINLSFLPGAGLSRSLSRKFNHFLEVFCTTIFLVIGQFFENPYSGVGMGNGDLKRPLSPFSLEDEEEGDDEVQMNPLKRRKFSF